MHAYKESNVMSRQDDWTLNQLQGKKRTVQFQDNYIKKLECRLRDGKLANNKFQALGTRIAGCGIQDAEHYYL